MSLKLYLDDFNYQGAGNHRPKICCPESGLLTSPYSIIISTFTQEKDEMLTKASGREIQDTPNEKAGS